MMNWTGVGEWIQSYWRPTMMIIIIFILANNYLFFPYISLFTDESVIMELPDKLYNLMSIGAGSYIVGRTTEKGLKILKGK